MFKLNTFASAVIVGSLAFSASAFAGSLTETSSNWKMGFSFDDSTHEYTRTRHVDYDTGYKSGGTRITRTLISDFYVLGSELSENGYELIKVEFDPSQLATAASGNEDMRPKVIDMWKPNYSLDDSDHRYHLNK